MARIESIIAEFLQDKSPGEQNQLQGKIAVIIRGKIVNIHDNVAEALVRTLSQKIGEEHIDFISISEQSETIHTNSLKIREKLGTTTPGMFILTVNGEHYGNFTDGAQLVSEIKEIKDAVISIKNIRKPRKAKVGRMSNGADGDNYAVGTVGQLNQGTAKLELLGNL